MLRKLSILFIFFVGILANVFAQVTIKPISPTVDYREANIIDKLLCAFNLQTCHKAIFIYPYNISNIVREGNIYKIVVKAKPVIKDIVINERNIVYSNLKIYDYPIRIEIPDEYITTKGSQYVINIKDTDLYTTLQLPSKFTITFLVENGFSDTVYLKTINFDFVTYKSVDWRWQVSVELDTAVQWNPGETLSAIFVLDAIRHRLYYIFGDLLEKIYHQSRLDGTSCKEAGLFNIAFLDQGGNLIAVCAAESMYNYKCEYGGSNIAASVSICGTTHNVLRAYYRLQDLTGIAYLTTTAHIVDDYMGESCNYDEVAVDNDADSEVVPNMVYECYTCPPNSHNPGIVFEYGDYPWCVCDPGYENRDNPVGGDVSKAYITDANGCEYRVYNCPAQITISPDYKEITEGESTTFSVTIKNTGTDTCTYTLSYDGCSDILCELSDYYVTLSGGSSTTITLYVATDPGDAGTYEIYVIAHDPNGNTYSDYTILNVKAAVTESCSVDIWIDPTSKTITAGQTALYTVYIRNNGNTRCTYSLTYNCPSEVSCSLSQSSVTLDAGSQTSLTLTAYSNNVGTYTLSVTAYSTSPVSGYSDTASATLEVQEPYSCDVDLIVDSGTKTAEPGQEVQFIVTIKNMGNTVCTYSLSEECPTQVTCTLSTTTVTLNPGLSSTVILTAKSDYEGEYTLRVTAQAQHYTGSDEVDMVLIVIAGANPPDISISPSSVTMYVNETKTLTVTIKNLGKQTTTYTLSVDCPANLICNLSKTEVTIDPGMSTSVYLDVKGIEAGEYLIEVIAEGPKQEKDTAYAYIIVKTKEQPVEEPISKPTPTETKPTGQAIPYLSVTPSLEINEGETGSIFITVKNIGDAPGTFTITVTCPTGLMCELSQTQVTLSPNQQATIVLTIYGETAGEYDVTITAKDGQTATATVSVTVKRLGLQAMIPWDYAPWLALILILIILLIWRLT